MCKTRRAAFTLVELLVVIGIIAVLVAILLPAINRARHQAWSVACKSNLRQLAMWARLYGDDHGVLPHNGGEPNVDSVWWEISAGNWGKKVPADWVDNKKSPMYCPMTRAIFGSEVHHHSHDKTDYSLNTHMGGRRLNARTKYPKPNLLSHKTALFADAMLAISSGKYYPWYYFLLGTYDPWPWNTSLPVRTELRGHPGNRANFAFGDGHVESLVREDYYGLDAQSRKIFSGVP